MNTFKNIRGQIIWILCFFIIAFPACIKTGFAPEPAAPTSLIPAIFGNNMVLQQNTDVPVWGWALAGSTVKVKPSWGNEVTTIVNKNGKWSLSVKTPIAISGQAPTYTLTISSINKTVTYTNILVGEVWVCGGQSNMTYQMNYVDATMKGVVSYPTEIAAATYPNIRLFLVGKDSAESPLQTCRGSWNACSPSSVKGFSGVGYYFGTQLYNAKGLNVPIGLIEDAISGSSIQCWMKQSVLESDATLKAKYIAPARKGLTTDPYRLYNAMLAPIIPYAIKGFIWYQGESNAGDGSIYTKANIAMLRDWRSDWGTTFSFYGTELTPRLWGYIKDINYDRALFREYQAGISSEPKAGIVPTGDVLLDTSELQLTHPQNKKDIGNRLGLLALGTDYAQPIQYLGPMYLSNQIVGSTIVINFKTNTVGSGLKSKDGTSLKCFKMAGADKIFYPATAIISGNTIIVSCQKVSAPQAVRYAMTNGAMTNLMNNEGLNAYPFRTDNWATVTNIDGAVEIL